MKIFLILVVVLTFNFLPNKIEDKYHFWYSEGQAEVLKNQNACIKYCYIDGVVREYTEYSETKGRPAWSDAKYLGYGTLGNCVPRITVNESKMRQKQHYWYSAKQAEELYKLNGCYPVCKIDGNGNYYTEAQTTKTTPQYLDAFYVGYGEHWYCSKR